MPLFYDKAIRSRLESCRDLLAPPDTSDPVYGPVPRYRSINEQRQVERLSVQVIYAEPVSPDNPWTDSTGTPIPDGDYAITRSDGAVFRSAKDFFESVWAPYTDFSQPNEHADRNDIVSWAS